VSTHIQSIRRARTIPVFLALLVLGSTIALKLGVARSDAAVSPTMHAVVHQDNTITLTFDDGSPVGNQARDALTVPAGTYAVRVVDDTGEHNFHLSGPGVQQATSVDGSDNASWTVTIQAGGTYRFQCDTHADFMYGTFQGAGAGTSGGTSGGSSSGGSSGGSSSGGSSSGGSSSGGSSSTTALRGTLAGTVAADGKLKLLFNGRVVSKLKAGRYKITVSDRTPARSFVVKQPGRSAITVSGVAFVGSHTVTVNLKVGAWTFYTSAGKKSTSSFTVVA
jgi:plastocyanin